MNDKIFTHSDILITHDCRWLHAYKAKTPLSSFYSCVKVSNLQSPIFLYFSTTSIATVKINGNTILASNCRDSESAIIEQLEISQLIDLGENDIEITSRTLSPSDKVACFIMQDSKPLLTSNSSWLCRPFNGINKLDLLSTTVINHLQAKEQESPSIKVETFFIEDPAPIISKDNYELSVKKLQSSQHWGNFSCDFNNRTINFNRLISEDGHYLLCSSLEANSNMLVTYTFHTEFPSAIFINGEIVAENVSYQIDPATGTKLMTAQAPISKGENSFEIFIKLQKHEHNQFSIAAPNLNLIPANWKISAPLRLSMEDILSAHHLDFKSHKFLPAPEGFIFGSNFYRLNNCFFKNQSTINTNSITQSEIIYFQSIHTANGYLSLKADGSPGDIIDVFYLDKKYTTLKSQDLCRLACDTILLQDSGFWQSTMEQTSTGILICGRKVSQTITISKVAIKDFGYIPRTGHFKSKSEKLNQIYDNSLRTLEACYKTQYLDSPYGEQLQYLYDAFYSSKLDLEVFNRKDLSKKALLQFTHTQLEDGKIPAVFPNIANLKISDYSLYWVIWLERHLFLTSDDEVREICLPALEKLLSLFHSHTTQTQGLLGNEFARHAFIDHEARQGEGYNTALNALYCKALFSASNIFKISSKDKKASNIHQRGLHTAAILHKYAWSNDRQLFKDTFTAETQEKASYSLATNIIALNCGIVNNNYFDQILNQIMLSSEPYFRLPIGDKLSPALMSTLIEAAISNGHREWALDLLRWYWGSMIDEGLTTWPEFHNPLRNLQRPCLESRPCFAYGSLPALFLTQLAGGLNRDKHDPKLFHFSPVINKISGAQAQLTTRRGILKVRWQFNDTESLEALLTCNEKISVLIHLPANILEKATFRIEGKITILQD